MVQQGSPQTPSRLRQNQPGGKVAFGKKTDEDVEMDEFEEDSAEETEETIDSADESDFVDEWDELDAQDWREDGPFDIDEVDLSVDDVERIDFGGLVLTPFEGMQMQLQVEAETNALQAILIMHDQSGLELSLFAAPASSSLISDIRLQMIASTESAGGEVKLATGPFGTEIRRVLPMVNPEGKQVYHVSRTWFVQGPKWLLRGVVMGKAAMEEGISESTELLYETFCNLVVNRGKEAMAPGQLIPLKLPAQA